MNLLPRENASIPTQAWSILDSEARTVLENELVGRKLAKVAGPHGLSAPGVNLGTLGETKQSGGVLWGSRQVLPFVEARAKFTVSAQAIDALARGAQEEADLDDLRRAAVEAARFEDSIVFDGLEDAGMRGLRSDPAHETISRPKEMSALPGLIAEAQARLSPDGGDGPFYLIVGQDYHQGIAKETGGYPISLHLSELVSGGVIFSPTLAGAVLMAAPQNSLQIDIGVDFSVGCLHVDASGCLLCLVESFAVRVLEPRAVQLFD